MCLCVCLFIFMCDILYWFCLVSILILLWMIGKRCNYKDQDAHIFCNICADGERAVIVLCSTCTNPGKSIVVACLHCFGCGQVKLVLNSAKCFVANVPWTSVSSTFVGCVVYPASGCDYVRLVWQGLMPLTLPCVSFQFRVAWYLCAVTWLSCDQFCTVKRIERCTIVVHIYIYIYLYIYINMCVCECHKAI